MFGSCSDFPDRNQILGKLGLKDSASSAKVAKNGSSPAKGMVLESKTFRDGLIYIYKRADYKMDL